jgi:hypothetical protein
MPSPRMALYRSDTARATRDWPTSTNVTRRACRPPAVSTIKALAGVLLTALHQQTQCHNQHDQNAPSLMRALSPGWSTRAPTPARLGWWGVASRRPPRGLPRDSRVHTWHARPTVGKDDGAPGKPRGRAALTVDGMPHGSQRTRSSVGAKHCQASDKASRHPARGPGFERLGCGCRKSRFRHATC